MSTEAITPQNPAPTPGNTDADVRARFNESISQLTTEQRGNMIVNTPPKQNEPDQSGSNPPGGKGAETPKPKDKPSQAGDVPDEFFKDTTKVDEWDRITNEEHKGHVTNDHWKNYKSLTKTKVEALTRELEEVRKKIPGDDFVPEKLSKRIQDLESSLKERDDLISRKYVQESPQFVEKFTSKEKIIDNQIQKLGKELGLEDDQVHGLLNASLKRRMSLLGEIDGSGAQASMASLLLQKDRISEEKSEFLAEHEKNGARFEEESRAKQDAEKADLKKLYDGAFNDVLKQMEESYGPLKRVEGKDDWNKSIEEDIKLARSMFNGENFEPKRDAEAFIQAATAKRLNRMFETAQKRAIAAEKELADLKAAGPSASQAQDGNGHDATKNMSADERAAFTFNQAQATAKNNGFSRR